MRGPGQHPGGGGAVLAGVEVARRRRCRRRRRAMSASSNTTTGALPPSSRWTRFSPSAAARATSMPARTDPVIDTICGMSWLTSARPVSAVAADHVEHAGRQELGGDLGQQQGGHRRGVRRLEHHRVARGERRGELPDRHHHRVVPRRHLGAHPDRLAPDDRGVAGQVLPGRRALQDAGRAGEEPELVDQRRQLLGQRQGDRLAGVAALGLDDLLGPRLDRVGEPAAGRGCAAPGWRRASPRWAAAAARSAASTSAGPETGARAYASPVLGSTTSLASPRGRLNVLAVDEVGQVRQAERWVRCRCQRGLLAVRARGSHPVVALTPTLAEISDRPQVIP